MFKTFPPKDLIRFLIFIHLFIRSIPSNLIWYIVYRRLIVKVKDICVAKDSTEKDQQDDRDIRRMYLAFIGTS